MKPLKRILFFAVITSAIVLFWLVPGINTAREVKYTRVYEDTDVPVIVSRDSVPQKAAITIPAETTKKYKTESIEPDATLEDIKFSNFSRAIHFHEMLLIDTMLAEDELLNEIDSVIEVKTLLIDSIQLAAIDTVANLQ